MGVFCNICAWKMRAVNVFFCIAFFGGGIVFICSAYNESLRTGAWDFMGGERRGRDCCFLHLPRRTGTRFKAQKNSRIFSRGSFFYKSAELFSPAANAERKRKQPEYSGKRGGFGDGDI